MSKEKVKEFWNKNKCIIISSVVGATAGVTLLCLSGKSGGKETWSELGDKFSESVGKNCVAKHIGKCMTGKNAGCIAGVVDDVSLSKLGEFGAELVKVCEVPDDTAIRVMFGDMKAM